ncbi:MAG: cation:proton antiporter [Planctomycetes bacterium]|nr:cation:proton antiporter [Planctomycetota bacterium]
MHLLAIFLGLVFAWSLVSKRFERSLLTAPIAFTAAGILLALLAPSGEVSHASQAQLLGIAEVGLVLLLFADASHADLRVLRSSRSLPLRLLALGMPLTIALGALGAILLFPGMSLWEAGILAAILAPTDAGLGQVIVNHPRVPAKIRQALNAEAGLNDGLSVPFLLFFMAVVEQQLADAAASAQPSLLSFLWEQLGLGALLGIGIGWGGGKLLGFAHRRGAIAAAWQPLGVVVLPLLCLLASEELHASMFIAAFVGGLAVQRGFEHAPKHAVEFTESWGQLFNLSVFFLFGLILPLAIPHLEIRHIAYALASLTVVRMLPVAIALVGARLDRSTILFTGWFGPRGLASIVLGLVYLEEQLRTSSENDLRLAVIATVMLSIFLHGMSAAPGAALYARRVQRLAPEAPERAEI